MTERGTEQYDRHAKNVVLVQIFVDKEYSGEHGNNRKHDRPQMTQLSESRMTSD
ncbi:MAG: hypothetical protein NTY82_02545 [Actinobacteria bacterium]|nr:hypothetical protein [Actinomycetota bacterium]